MINLTSAQMAIVKDDETVKNFRAHFPNGERADLTNSDIVFESVNFKESVCSDQSFRFGSADASCIEFETVGVGNIIGLTIECSMTFTLGNEAVTVPYGTFIVDSCPRDHSNMVHRKVTAYSYSVNNGYIQGLENWKLRTESRLETYLLKPYYLLAELGFLQPDTETAQTLTTGTSHKIYDSSYEGATIGILTATMDEYFALDVTNALDAVYKITATGQLVPDSTAKFINSAIVEYAPPSGSLSSLRAKWYYAKFRADGNGFICENIYPNAPEVYDNGTVTLYIPKVMTVSYHNTMSPSDDWTETYNLFTSATITKGTASGSAEQITMLAEPTSGIENYYKYIGAFELADIVYGFAELNAAMVRTERDGTYTLFRLDNSDPYGLTASDVEGSAWWDEYDVRPIGSVEYKYKDADGNDVEDILSWDSSGSVYDMRSNYVLQNMVYDAGFPPSSFITSLFKPYASVVQFTPLEATFRGMPYLQCGDAITLTAADGTVINSYILNQSFGGIQHISQDVETVQGTVIGSEIVY